MRISLGTTGLVLLLAVGIWPVALLLLYAGSPVLAARVALAAEAAGKDVLYCLLVGAGLALLFYPPFPAWLRHAGALLLRRLRTDRGPLLRAQGELRNFETPARQLEAGRAALAAADPAAALPHLLRALELDGELVAAHHLLGQALLQLGQPEAARAPLTAALAREPGHAFGDSLLLLGRAHMLSGDHRTAAELLARHAKEHGGNRKSRFWLGACLRALGDEAGARAAFEVAAAPPPPRPRLTAEENFYRARARVALWRRRRPA